MYSVTIPVELAALSTQIDAWCTASHAGPGDDLHHETEREMLRYTRALINRLELDFARQAAAFAEKYDESFDGNPSPGSWIREHCRMTSHASMTAVRIGQEYDRLHASAAALVEGRIGIAHMGLMAQTAQDVRTGVKGNRELNAAFNEASLLRKAERLSVQRFRTACRHVVHAADRAGFLELQAEDRECRTLTMRKCGDGLEMTGWFDAEGAAWIRTALEPMARRLGPDDERERERRNADALVELCQGALDGARVPSRGSQRPHLQVTTTLETLLGLTGAPAGELEHADLVSAETVQRFACDATITRVLVDAQSMVIDVGRSQRVVHGATRRALNVRDKGCRWPGCERSMSYTQAHHIEHWVRQGTTDLPNLALLCTQHHWNVHEGGWQFVRTEDDEVMVFPPRPDHVVEPRWWSRPRSPAVAATA